MSLIDDATSVALFADIPRQIFVINQFDPMTRPGSAIARSLGERMGRRLLGVVHRDEHVGEALAAQKPIASYAPRSQAHHDLAVIACRPTAMVGG
ncbi:cellulose synthase operon protein YhjQ/BcsQ [Nguyenibacter sp. L1]|uniref:cellulose synthase operon protein YhjQ/BcsQ n=1 Tax=Nguyenibacter sp. L1 TaxID=3049350 RepID=UPI002B49D385|nr:cellulose synthase operon protein YhjQ/BcsQ [Nguyenibacter sp. L1]WRH88487.1 cellulose synthase operon protein YhjQ/BcsQ [Nguyenibacter sp. L1]